MLGFRETVLLIRYCASVDHALLRDRLMVLNCLYEAESDSSPLEVQLAPSPNFDC